MDRLHLMHKHHTKGAGQARTDIDKLWKDPSVQQSYQEQLHNTLTNHHLSQDLSEALLDYMKTSAAKTVGELKRENNTQYTADPTVTKLSEQQKVLRIKINQHGKSEDRTALRKERNNLCLNAQRNLATSSVMETDEGKASATKDWFQQQFTDQ